VIAAGYAAGFACVCLFLSADRPLARQAPVSAFK
jgi:hypothetical protein